MPQIQEEFLVVTANLSGNKLDIRYVNGEKFWVVPGTIAKHGVMRGSRGSIYYPDPLFNSTCDRWNKQPVIINHTFNEKGNPVSCLSEDTLDEVCVGFTDNSYYQDGDLKVEFWLSEERLYTVNRDVADKIKARKKLEVSTGLLSKTKKAKDGAVFNGQSYDQVLVDYKTDHVAILTDEKGACSVEQGCGVFNSSKDDEEDVFKEWAEKKLKVTFNELSHSGVRDLLHTQLRKKYSQDDDYVWIVEVYDDYIIYSEGSQLYRLNYTQSESDVTLSDGTPQKVNRVIEYVTVNKENDMPKENKNRNDDQQQVELDEKKVPLINSLIENENSYFKEDDKPVLNQMSECRLKELNEQFKQTANEKHDMENEEDDTKKNAKKKEENQTANSSAPLTPEEWYNAAPPEIQATWNHAARLEKEHKEGLVKKILEHAPEDKQTEEMTANLMKKDIEDLEERVALLPEKKEEAEPQSKFRRTIFNGASEGKPTTNSKRRVPLTLPSVPDFSNSDN
jgi:hypothetical protein